MLEKLTLGFDQNRGTAMSQLFVCLILRTSVVKFGSFSYSEPAFGVQRKLDNLNC
jgi:hypothetical protein